MSKLSKADITELKSLGNPPAMVKDIVAVVLLLLGYTEKESKDWKINRKVMANAEFLKQLQNCDTSKIPPESIQKAKATLDEMNPDNVAKVSLAAFSLLQWANTMVSGTA